MSSQQSISAIRVSPSFFKLEGKARDEGGTGRVVVRLVEELEKGLPARSLAEHARLCGHTALLGVLAELGDPKTERLIRSVPLEKLLDLEQRAARTDFRPLHSLSQYWQIDLRDRLRADVARCLQALRQVREVDAAWEETLSIPATVTPGDDDYNAGQGYEDAAPTGIDSRWMWTQPDGEGAGVGVVDVEGGWRTTHEDLVAKTPTIIHGVNNPSGWEDHGTAVLGEILATDNTVGVVGCAPAITSIRMASIYDAAFTQQVPDAIAAAIAAMTAGEILLIELQTGAFLPEETKDELLDLFRLATALGILVVEAGANGGQDLDAWVSSAGTQRMNRASPDFVDSGALMVGASVSAVPHERWTYSNYGSRMDCFAWGENVTTCGYGDLDDGGGDADKEYTDTFQGTSSASPIIVSAAALVQSRYKAIAGSLLSPGQLRAVLADPATGTAQGGTVAGAIGVMPDLSVIAPQLGLVPDLYLRDAVGDVGVVPWSGSISVSPDVIVSPDAVADPQAAFGEGSGTENSATLGSTVEAGQDNFIYVRLRNRGGTEATNVVATVYWSEVATLVTPSMWHLIGTVTIPAVPVGDLLTVSPGLAWTSDVLPGEGHYCFVATLQHANDPAPPVPTTMDWTTFRDMIRGHNNVTWRNFNVVNELPDPPSAVPPFAFLITGAEDRPLPFEFEVQRRLPRDARLELHGPHWLLARLRGRNAWELTVDRKKGAARLVLPSLPRVRLSQVVLEKGARLRCRFVLNGGKARLAWGHGVAIRQLHHGEEVGQVAWQFAPRMAHCRGEKRANNG